jgi:hypothetical protein
MTTDSNNVDGAGGALSARTCHHTKILPLWPTLHHHHHHNGLEYKESKKKA